MSVPKPGTIRTETMSAAAVVATGTSETACRALSAALEGDDLRVQQQVNRLSVVERSDLVTALERVREATSIADQGGDINAALLRAAIALYRVEQDTGGGGTLPDLPPEWRREYVRRARAVVAAFLDDGTP